MNDSLSKEFLASKQEELNSVARSIDLWKGTPQSEEQKRKVSALLARFEVETLALEKSFLEKKLEIFTEMLAVLKGEK